jgi:hypothetical protein
MDFPIPRTGTITLEDGVLVCRGRQGQVTNVGYVAGDDNGNDYLAFTNEVTIVQRDDPPKLRLCTIGAQWRVSLGLVSFNKWWNGCQRELAWMRGSITEDAQDGQLGGQFDEYIVERGKDEPTHAVICSDAYSDRDGKPRQTRVLMANPQDGLKEFA